MAREVEARRARKKRRLGENMVDEGSGYDSEAE